MIETLALMLGAGWASGINLYATLFMLGFAGSTGILALPPDLQILAHPLVIGAAGLMYAVEFLTDKIPGVDTVWDTLHTFIRIPAGALLAAGAVGEAGMAMELAALIVGGGLATGSHAAKAGSRVLINTSPEPFSNWTASIGEDVTAFGGLWLAFNYPLLFLALLALFLLFLVWFLPKIWRGIKGVFNAIGRLFGGGQANDDSPSPPTPSA